MRESLPVAERRRRPEWDRNTEGRPEAALSSESGLGRYWTFRNQMP
jgi:hypothetical protein